MMRRMADPRYATSPDLVATVPEDSSVPAIGAPAGWPAGTQVADRFVVNGALGRGSSGEVLAVQDLSLDREVAMKVLRGAGGPAIARFMREARITAKLDHPSVPPVHTLEFLPDGGLIFTMRKLDGQSLGEAMRRRSAGGSEPAIATVNAMVSLGLRICDALSRAHFLGVIHRDVKPDNIMLGAHGEVALVDWGECRLLDEADAAPAGSTVGTPAYMSPEQARGESVGASSDVYALGATLYHLITRSHPTWDEDPERFWQKKRAGVVDPLPPAAAAQVPRPLLAILRRALVADPAGRYVSVSDLARDLERFQAGLAVEAYRESSAERTLRWLHRHRRAILVAAAMAAVCVVAGGLLWREHLRQLADWGPPILVEDFSDESWRQRWFEEQPGLWQTREGRLVADGPARNLLVLDRVLGGAVAVEYDGEMMPGANPGDLSIIWSEDQDLVPGKRMKEGSRGFMVQAGAFDNYFCAVYRWPDGARLDQRPYRVASGVRHHFRVELDGRRIGMWIDGARVLDAADDLPITSGRLCFYAWYPGKAFDNVRVYQKRLPQVTSVLAIGEAFQLQRQPKQAALAFREVAESHPGTDLAVEARYRQGQSLREAGDLPAALQAWGLLPPGEQADRVAGHLLDQQADEGRIIEACSALSDLYLRSPAVRRQLRAQWQTWALRAYVKALQTKDPDACLALAQIKLRLFPEHAGSDLECANLLNSLGRYEEVATRFPNEVTPCSHALRCLGRAEESLNRFADAPNTVYEVRMALGRFADELTDPRADEWRRTKALCQMGRAQEAMLLAPNAGMPLLWLGRPDQLLEHGDPSLRAAALAALGRWDEALAVPYNATTWNLPYLSNRADPRVGGDNPFAAQRAWRLIRLTALRETAMRDALLARSEVLWPAWQDWISHILIAPIVRVDRHLLRQRLELAWSMQERVAGGRPQVLAGFVLGHVQAEAFTAAPCAGESDLWHAVGLALQAELAGDAATIKRAWQGYLDLPWHRRITRDFTPDVALEALAAWRTTAEEQP